MPSCERCWRESACGPYDDHAAKYLELVAEREASGACTPEQQAGEDAFRCPKCKRRTLHQHCHICMACGHDGSNCFAFRLRRARIRAHLSQSDVARACSWPRQRVYQYETGRRIPSLAAQIALSLAVGEEMET